MVKLNRFTDVLDCTILPLLINYIELPLHYKSTRVRDWDPVVEKREERLNNWKGDSFFKR